MLIEIDDSYLVGIPEIDKDHLNLIAVFNNLLLNFTVNIDKVEYWQPLVQHLEQHFSCEEEYMRKIGFPDRHKHLLIHKELIDSASRTIMLSNRMDLKYTLKILAENILNHIKGMDKQIGNYYRLLIT